MKAGLQEWATVSTRDCWPWPSWFEQRIVEPMTLMEPVQLTVVLSSMTPSSSAAASVRILNVEPGS